MKMETVEMMNVGGNACVAMGIGYLIREIRHIKRVITSCPVCAKKSKVCLERETIL